MTGRKSMWADTDPTMQPITVDPRQAQIYQRQLEYDPALELDTSAIDAQRPQMQAPGTIPGGVAPTGFAAYVPYAGAAAGTLLGGLLLGTGLRDAARGKGGNPAGRLQAGFTTGGLSELGRFGARLWGSGKDKDQQSRDAMRAKLVDSGMLGKDYNVNLSGGRKFDIGKDGSTKAYNVDFAKAGAGDAVGATQGLAAILARGMGQKQKDDLTGYFANAAQSSGKYNADDARALYSQFKIDKKTAFDLTNEMARRGEIDDQRKAAYQNSFNTLFAAPPSSSRRK